MLANVSAQLVPDPFVLLLGPQMQVERAQRRRKRVRFANRRDQAARIMNPKLVRENLTLVGYQDLEQTRFTPRQHLARRLTVKHHKYLLRVGAIGADNHSAIGRMRAKNRMRIVMPEREQALQFLGWNV